MVVVGIAITVDQRVVPSSISILILLIVCILFVVLADYIVMIDKLYIELHRVTQVVNKIGYNFAAMSEL